MSFLWTGGPQQFQILPMVLQLSPEQPPKWYTVPRQYYAEVPLVHPHHSWFAALGLKWYSTPAVANMELSLGGIKYTGALRCAVLCCAVPCRAVLGCVVLCRAVLGCVVLCRAVPTAAQRDDTSVGPESGHCENVPARKI